MKNMKYQKNSEKSRKSGLLLFLLIGILTGVVCLMQRDLQEKQMPRVAIPEQMLRFADNYPEAQEFVQNYPEKYDKKHKINLKSEVTLGKIPLFLQWDERWGYTPYGDGWIGDSGCGPTCMAMVVCGLTGDTKQNPLTIAAFCEEQGYYIPDVGTSWDLMTTGAEHFGIHGTETEITEQEILAQLSENHPMICSMSPGDFTKGGHFIVLTEITENGMILLNDPNSRIHSEKQWNPEDLIPQIKHIWYYTS